MGLLIKDNIVHVVHECNEHLITTSEGNPKLSKISTIHGEIEVLSVFTRLKNSAKSSRDRSAKRLGDNCPIIYAFKGIEDLKTTTTSIKKLIREGRKIIAKNTTITKETALVCTPSSHNIVRYFAKMISRQCGAPIIDNIFVKASKESAIEDLNNEIIKTQSYQDRKEIKNLIDKLNKSESLSMKLVPTKYRHLINPLSQNKIIEFKSVIIVDDLISTGSTFISGKNILISQSSCEDVKGISLFSEL